ncbi:hypothetical protein BDV10DRAFT_180782 [Aspergillus recurvatus]
MPVISQGAEKYSSNWSHALQSGTDSLKRRSSPRCWLSPTFSPVRSHLISMFFNARVSYPRTTALSPHGFEFVDALPYVNPANHHPWPVTLASFIQNKQSNMVLLEDKFHTAARICDSIWNLHTYGLLHENVNSPKIITVHPRRQR